MVKIAWFISDNHFNHENIIKYCNRPFKNAKENVRTISNLPLEKILVETDCPYLAPTPYRGKRNEPKYILHVVEKMSEILGVSTETIVNATNLNTQTLFPRIKAKI